MMISTMIACVCDDDKLVLISPYLQFLLSLYSFVTAIRTMSAPSMASPIASVSSSLWLVMSSVSRQTLMPWYHHHHHRRCFYHQHQYDCCHQYHHRHRRRTFCCWCSCCCYYCWQQIVAVNHQYHSHCCSCC